MPKPARDRARHAVPPAPLRRGRAPAIPTVHTTVAEAKLFMNGRSQAVRLPADYRFEGDAVYVKRWRNGVILLPKEDPWRSLLDSLGNFSDDFMHERNQPRTVDRRPAL